MMSEPDDTQTPEQQRAVPGACMQVPEAGVSYSQAKPPATHVATVSAVVVVEVVKTVVDVSVVVVVAASVSVLTVAVVVVVVVVDVSVVVCQKIHISAAGSG